MKNIVSVVAVIATIVLIIDSLYRFCSRNTKRYIQDNEFFF